MSFVDEKTRVNSLAGAYLKGKSYHSEIQHLLHMTRDMNELGIRLDAKLVRGELCWHQDEKRYVVVGEWDDGLRIIYDAVDAEKIVRTMLENRVVETDVRLVEKNEAA